MAQVFGVYILFAKTEKKKKGTSRLTNIWFFFTTRFKIIMYALVLLILFNVYKYKKLIHHYPTAILMTMVYF